jgi:trehalose/maltose hydrolase-like predicted phosphorylase
LGKPCRKKWPGHYDINNVVAADEWAENVNNNAFTNAGAKSNLQFATEAAKVLGITPDPDWMNVANNIPILKMENGVTREHATYNGEGIKQADVNLLSYPLKQITDAAQIKKDLEYYETRVPNEGTPAMTQAVFTTLYSRLGNTEKAYHWFKESYVPNLNPPFRVIAETKGGTNPYFATGGRRHCSIFAHGFWWIGYYFDRDHSIKNFIAKTMEKSYANRCWHTEKNIHC